EALGRAVGGGLARGALDDAALLHPAAVFVDEGVGEDLEKPRLHVGAALELVEETEGAEKGVLHQVFGVALVLGGAQTGGVRGMGGGGGGPFDPARGGGGVFKIEHPSRESVPLPIN